ncbi:MAG: flagellar hook basal-body protein [Alphaproteobacteria bacterium]|nr:flagellar hook basal-body protein [Alphaproteobacteria bacterium]
MENITTVVLSRLVAQTRALEVTASNLANASTPGFHASRTVFTDWLEREPMAGEPPGGNVVAYTQDRATYRDRTPGERRHTGNPLDLAIGNADGWFTVMTRNGPRLTRAGHFALGPDGTIMDTAGNALLDSNGHPLRTTAGDARLTITGDGTVSGDSGPIGRVGVVRVQDENKLVAEGANLLRADTSTTQVRTPQIVQGAIEGSNVQPVLELNRMMDDMRSFQLTTQMLQSESDRMAGAIQKILAKGS